MEEKEDWGGWGGGMEEEEEEKKEAEVETSDPKCHLSNETPQLARQEPARPVRVVTRPLSGVSPIHLKNPFKLSTFPLFPLLPSPLSLPPSPNPPVLA